MKTHTTETCQDESKQQRNLTIHLDRFLKKYNLYSSRLLYGNTITVSSVYQRTQSPFFGTLISTNSERGNKY